MLIQDLSMAAPARPWIPIQSLPPWFYSHLNAPLTTTFFWLTSKGLQYIVLMSCVTGEAWRSWWADFFTPFSRRVCSILEAVEFRKRDSSTPLPAPLLPTTHLFWFNCWLIFLSNSVKASQKCLGFVSGRSSPVLILKKLSIVCGFRS